MYGEMVYQSHPNEFSPVSESAYCGARVLQTMLLHTNPATKLLSLFEASPAGTPSNSPVLFTSHAIDTHAASTRFVCLAIIIPSESYEGCLNFRPSWLLGARLARRVLPSVARRRRLAGLRRRRHGLRAPAQQCAQRQPRREHRRTRGCRLAAGPARSARRRGRGRQRGNGLVRHAGAERECRAVRVGRPAFRVARRRFQRERGALVWIPTADAAASLDAIPRDESLCMNSLVLPRLYNGHRRLRVTFTCYVSDGSRLRLSSYYCVATLSGTSTVV